MSSFNEWLAEATPDRREIVICMDRRLISALATAKDALTQAKTNADGMLGGGDIEAARELVADLEEKVRAKSRTMVLEGIGWGAWRDLAAQHPPAHDQAEVFQRAVQLGFAPHSVENLAWNAETFIPAAIAASCIEPTITIKQVETYLRLAPAGVFTRIWAAAYEVNLAGADDPFVGTASAVASDGVRAIAKK